ncbi:MAG: hypothetical protein CMJ42_08310 [Phyllobacteriaceae bacterium]|nr:hypothetical protein [Phyllobacteriaceae bacterium]MBA89769.1 hypothetical protein [Phyllobacteriaceae bacterium]
MIALPLTPPEHEHTAAVDECARFLAVTPPVARPKPLVPAMREMFGITASDTCEAIRLANEMRREAVE